MKFVIRRAVAGIVLSPVFAGAYVLLNAILIGLGASPTGSALELFWLGLVLCLVFVTPVFAFFPHLVSGHVKEDWN